MSATGEERVNREEYEAICLNYKHWSPMRAQYLCSDEQGDSRGEISFAIWKLENTAVAASPGIRGENWHATRFYLIRREPKIARLAGGGRGRQSTVQLY